MSVHSTLQELCGVRYLSVGIRRAGRFAIKVSRSRQVRKPPVQADGFNQPLLGVWGINTPGLHDSYRTRMKFPRGCYEFLDRFTSDSTTHTTGRLLDFGCSQNS